MKYEEGPYWVQIDNCQRAIEVEKENIKWANARLLEDRSHYSLQLCEEFLSQAEKLLSESETELEGWTHKHFELSRKLEEIA